MNFLSKWFLVNVQSLQLCLLQKRQLFSHVWPFVTPCTVACQAPLAMEFSRWEFWSGLPFRSPGDLPDSGIEPGSPALRADSLPSEPRGKKMVKWPHLLRSEPCKKINNWKHNPTHPYKYCKILKNLSQSLILSHISSSLSLKALMGNYVSRCNHCRSCSNSPPKATEMQKVLIPSGLPSPGYLVLHITAGTSRSTGETSQGMLGSVGRATCTRWISSWEPLAGWRRPSSKPEHKAQRSLRLNRAVIHTGQYKNTPQGGSGRH